MDGDAGRGRWWGCGSWSWPGSGRGRTPRWCSPTSGPTSCASTGPAARCGSATRSCPTRTLRGRRRVAADLKDPAGRRGGAAAWSSGADVLIEGYRPGVAERLGVGPDDCHARNPRLVYGRMTGWGQDGPAGAARRARHQLHLAHRRAARDRPAGERPVPPLNLVGDFGGGGRCCCSSASSRRCGGARRPGRGQVVDAAMVDGASLLAMILGVPRPGRWADERGGQPARRRRAVLRHLQLRRRPARRGRARWSRSSTPQLLDGLGLDPATCRRRSTAAGWPALRERFAEVFATRTRDEWAAASTGTDACVTPGAGLRRGRRATRTSRPRGTIVAPDGVPQAAPGPAVLPHPRDAARAARRSRRTSSRCSPTGRVTTPRTAEPRPQQGRRVACRASGGRCRRPAGCGCGSGRPGCPGPWWSRP